jgi:hypothetical protein
MPTCQQFSHQHVDGAVVTVQQNQNFLSSCGCSAHRRQHWDADGHALCIHSESMCQQSICAHLDTQCTLGPKCDTCRRHITVSRWLLQPLTGQLQGTEYHIYSAGGCRQSYNLTFLYTHLDKQHPLPPQRVLGRVLTYHPAPRGLLGVPGGRVNVDLVTHVTGTGMSVTHSQGQ